MTNADLLTTEITVALPDGTVLTCQKLDMIGEQRIMDELGRALAATYGPGSYFANAKPVLDWLSEQGMYGDRQQMVSELTRLVAVKALPDMAAVFEFRATPDGLATELFLRTRKTHPDLAQPVIRTQLNAVTAWQVATDLGRKLAADPKR